VIYWDTSAAVKLYVEELDSPVWHRILVESPGPHVTSALLEAELAFALRGKEQRGDLRRGGATALLQQFRRDVARGRFTLFPLGADVILRATRLADEVSLPPGEPGLRTLDGLHLATAVLLRCEALVTADRRMQAGAARLGLPLRGRPASH